jgi:anti-anti-sigma factor
VELVAARLRVCPAPPADGAVCLRLEGQLDGASALALARVLLDALRHGDELVLDLSRLSRVDVAGLRVLVDCARGALRERCDLVLRAPSPAVRALFRLTGLGHWARLDEHGCVLATLPPRHRAVLSGFGRPGLI